MRRRRGAIGFTERWEEEEMSSLTRGQGGGEKKERGEVLRIERECVNHFRQKAR